MAKITINGIDVTNIADPNVDKRRKPTIILVHESTLSSIVKDAISYTTIAGLIGTGVYFDSTVMQIVGAGMALVMWLGSVGRNKDKYITECYTFDEARAAIDQLESNQ